MERRRFIHQASQVFRLASYAISCVYLLINYSATTIYLWPGIALIAVGFAYTLFLGREESSERIISLVAFDAVVFTGLILVSGGLMSPLKPNLFFVTMSSAYAFGARYALPIGLVIDALYILVALLHGGTAYLASSGLLPHLFYFPLVAYFSGYLADQEITLQEKLQKSVDDTHRLNQDLIGDYQALQSKVEEEISLAKLTRLVSMTKDLESMANRALDEVIRILDTKVAGLFLYDQEAEVLTLLADYKLFHPAYRHELKNLSLDPSGDCLVSEAAYFKKMVFDKVSEVGARHPATNLAHLEGDQLVLAAPIMVGTKLYGVLVTSAKEGNYRPEDLGRLDTVCDILGLSMQNLVLISKLRKQVALERAFVETAKSIVAKTSLEETLNLVLERAIELVGGNAGIIGLWDPEAGKGRYTSVQGLDGLKGREFALGQGVLAEVAASGQSRLITDYALGPEALESVLIQGVESLAAVPLSCAGEIQGVLGIVTKDGVRSLTARELQTLESFADLAASGINRANLYRKVSDKSQQLAALLSVSQQVAASFDLRTILNTVLGVAVEQTRSDWGLVCLVGSDGLLLDRVAAYGFAEGIPMGSHSTIESPLIQRLIAEKGMIHFKGKEEIANLCCFKGLEATNAVIIPLFGKDTLHGVLACATKSGMEYSPAKEEFLNHLALSAAIAVDNALMYQEIRSLADRDPLTGLYNQRLLYRHLEAECQRAQEHGQLVTFLMVDVDDFKLFNDHYGHQAGDKVLRQIAQIFLTEITESRYIYRYGGEEFCILLPGLGRTQGYQVAQRLHEAINREDCPVTLSIGVAVFPEDGKDMEQVIRLADSAMYKAKKSGKNSTSS